MGQVESVGAIASLQSECAPGHLPDVQRKTPVRGTRQNRDGVDFPAQIRFLQVWTNVYLLEGKVDRPARCQSDCKVCMFFFLRTLDHNHLDSSGRKQLSSCTCLS